MATFELNRRSVALLGVGAAAAACTGARAATSPSPWTSDGVVLRAGLRIHHVGMGEGPPLVLLHKLGGWVADWRRLAPLLPHRRIIAIDLPGHGDSRVQGPPPYMQSVAESAGAIMATLDELEVEHFDLVGNSLGGCIGVLMAACWPDRVTRFVALSVALTPRAMPPWTEVAPPGTWGPNGEPLVRSFEESRKVFGFTDLAIHEEQNASRAQAGAWVRASQRGVGPAGIMDYVSRINAPTLLIYGERGGYKQFERPGLAALKDGRAVHIPNVGSFTHQDDPAATATVLNAFLTPVRAAGVM